jgi:hypothetical protein
VRATRTDGSVVHADASLAAESVGTRASAKRVARNGVLGALAMVAALFAMEALLGRWPFSPVGDPRSLRIALVHCLIAADLPVACILVVHGLRETIAELLPHLDAVPGGVESFGRLGRREMAVAAALGVGLAVVGPALTEPGRAVLAWWRPSSWPPEVYWHRTLGLWVGGWLGVFNYAVVASSRRLSRLSERLRPIDLFDLRPLTPFTQRGLANGLLAVIPLALYGLISLEFGVTPMLLLMCAVSLAVVGVTLLLPVRGAHGRIVHAKRAELAWCGQALERERAAVRTQAKEGAGGRLADLLAYQGMVERVHEWPFSVGTLGRVALYSVIPLGSWVASSIVQHVIERYLFRP